MKYASALNILLPVLLLFAVTACNNHEAKTDGKSAALIDSVSTTAAKDTTVYIEEDHCTGAMPSHPTIDSSFYPGRKFYVMDRIGYDDFKTSKGDSISIKHANCEYTVYFVSIFTKRASHSITDTIFWAGLASDILTELKPAADEGMNIDSFSYYLRHYSDAGNKRDGDGRIMFAFVASDFHSSLSIDAIAKPDERYLIAVTLMRGPL